MRRSIGKGNAVVAQKGRWEVEAAVVETTMAVMWVGSGQDGCRDTTRAEDKLGDSEEDEEVEA